jgi:hypothetical protein
LQIFDKASDEMLALSVGLRKRKALGENNHRLDMKDMHVMDSNKHACHE